MTSIAELFRGGMPIEGGQIQNSYEDLNDSLKKHYSDSLDKDQSETVRFFAQYEIDRGAYNPLWAFDHALSTIKEDDPDKEFKTVVLDAISQLGDLRGEKPYLFIREFLKSRGHALTNRNEQIVGFFSIVCRGLEKTYLDIANSSLAKFGLKPTETVTTDFRTAINSFSQLDDGAYLIATPTYNILPFRGAYQSNSHALAVIVDKGRTYFYDPNIAIWKVDIQNASRLGEGILWNYMLPFSTHRESITITRLELEEQG